MKAVAAWTRENRWSLLALVVLATGSVLWSLHWDWQRYQDHNPTQGIDVARGVGVRYGGATVSLTDLTILAGGSPLGQGFGVLDGTDVVVADVRIVPPSGTDPDDSTSCDVHLRAPSPDGELEWWPEVTNPTTYGSGDPNVFGCNLAYGTVYTLREFFVVPAGAADVDPYIQVTTPAELPRALHLH